MGKPLVFILAPFFEAGSVFYTDEALVPWLYGTEEVEGMPPGFVPFFSHPRAQSVSAVLYCNQFTVPRFLRLATNWRSIAAPPAIRMGMCYVDQGEDFFHIQAYHHVLGHPSVPTETWSQSVTVFLNPFARLPLPEGILPCTSSLGVKDGLLHREVYGFHPVTSFMHVTVGGKEARAG